MFGEQKWPLLRGEAPVPQHGDQAGQHAAGPHQGRGEVDLQRGQTLRARHMKEDPEEVTPIGTTIVKIWYHYLPYNV